LKEGDGEAVDEGAQGGEDVARQALRLAEAQERQINVQHLESNKKGKIDWTQLKN